MMRSRDDLKRYLEADRVALGAPAGPQQRLMNDLWRFQRTLRWLEYRINTRQNRALTSVTRLRWRHQSRRLGFTIPPNVFGPGLSIPHFGTIVVNEQARVGANCRLHVGVTLGGSAEGAPTLGDNCYLGPGAKVFGPVVLGDNTKVGANAVVTKSFPEGRVTLAGVPAQPLRAERESAAEEPGSVR
jgi:serine O-acetyltransferase